MDAAPLASVAIGVPPLAASAIEGLGILVYAALVYLVMRMAARWADRALDEDAGDARPVPVTSKREDA